VAGAVGISALGLVAGCSSGSAASESAAATLPTAGILQTSAAGKEIIAGCFTKPDKPGFVGVLNLFQTGGGFTAGSDNPELAPELIQIDTAADPESISVGQILAQIGNGTLVVRNTAYSNARGKWQCETPVVPASLPSGATTGSLLNLVWNESNQSPVITGPFVQ